MKSIKMERTYYHKISRHHFKILEIISKEPKNFHELTKANRMPKKIIKKKIEELIEKGYVTKDENNYYFITENGKGILDDNSTIHIN
jgi:predicted transcriptional regulator